MMTVKDVAREMKVSTRTVWRWIKSGKLETIKIGGITRIDEKEFNRLIGKEVKNG